MLPPDPWDEDDDGFDDTPDLALCVHWKIGADWQLQDYSVDLNSVPYLVCRDDFSGDWYEVDTQAERWSRITYH